MSLRMQNARTESLRFVFISPLGFVAPDCDACTRVSARVSIHKKPAFRLRVKCLDILAGEDTRLQLKRCEMRQRRAELRIPFPRS